jgi:hypothetical protein
MTCLIEFGCQRGSYWRGQDEGHFNMVTVMGPPPGTGVIQDAFFFTTSKSTSPTMRPIGQTVDAHVDHHCATAHHLRHDQAGSSGGHDQDVGQNGVPGQVALNFAHENHTSTP